VHFVILPEAWDSGRHVDDLDRLLLRVTEEVHWLSFTRLDILENTPWFMGLRAHRKEALRAMALAGATSAPRLRVAVGQEITLEMAVRLAYRPLAVLVEDETSDGLLVETAVAAYGGEETRRLWNHTPSTAVVVHLDHGGGSGGLEKKLQKHIDEAKNDELPARLTRVVVLTDSDAKWLGDLSDKARSIQQLCEDHHIRCVVLSCRAIENYIPDDAFRQWANQPNQVNVRPVVEALLRLTDVQRDHFPMKGKKPETKGFPSIDRPDAPVQQKDLFREVPKADRLLLKGFGDDVIQRLRDLPSPTAEDGEPSIALRRQLAAALDGRDRRGDLRRLVTLIEEAL
jgi:hypothetical protein